MIKFEILSKEQKQLFNTLKKEEWIKNFYLAGGTALALQFGHRKSIDFDFFIESDFKIEELLQKIEKVNKFELLSEDKNTLYISINGIRVSFISYKYKLLEPFLKRENVNLSSVRDISCNKISALLSRGAKKDFIDLYYILRNTSLDDVFKDYKLKYGESYFNKYLFLKSLVFFEDADVQPMPVMLEKINWEEIKTFFVDLVNKHSG